MSEAAHSVWPVDLAGNGTGTVEGDSMDHIGRISALLAKAEATDNEHEQDAFLAKAQELATRHAIDLAVLRMSAPPGSAAENPERRKVDIGDYRKQANGHLVRLYVAIAHSNDVVVDVARDSTWLFAYGMPSDLDSVGAMFGSVAHQMVQSGNRHVAGRSWEGELSRQGYERPTPMNARRARAHFYVGFAVRIAERLAQGRRDAEQKSANVFVPIENGGPPISGVVALHSRGMAVRDYHSGVSTARGSWSGSRVEANSDSTRLGFEAGGAARLAAPRSLTG